MRINHVALWAKDLEKLKSFYKKYFKACPGKRYINETRKFTSYFLKFEEGPSLEIMHQPEYDLPRKPNTIGFAHFAFSVGSQEEVNLLTEKLRSDGYTIVSEPRTTGDGYYESVVSDPEGNWVEITP